MKNFLEWIKLKENNMHLGRPHGPMGPDGKIYGHSGGPLGRVSGTGTWTSSPAATGRQLTPPSIPSLEKSNHNSEAEGLWKANGPLARLSYLSSIPNAKHLGLHMMSWGDLPPEAQEAARKEMNSSPPTL